MNTPAVRAAYTYRNAYVSASENCRICPVGGPPDPRTSARTAIAVAQAAAVNSIATNNKPLPRKTVEKKRSSRSPILSRTTPMNHRNAIPAKGIP